jgi:hypothetical protein
MAAWARSSGWGEDNFVSAVIPTNSQKWHFQIICHSDESCDGAVTDSILFQLQKTVAEQGALFAIQYIPNMLDVARNDAGAFARLTETCVAGNIPLVPNPINLFNSSETE